jgi:hypothetical protein
MLKFARPRHSKKQVRIRNRKRIRKAQIPNSGSGSVPKCFGPWKEQVGNLVKLFLYEEELVVKTADSSLVTVADQVGLLLLHPGGGQG